MRRAAAAPPFRCHVFALLTEPAALVSWWPDVAELEPRIGGRVRLVFEVNEITGRVPRFEPPQALAFTWTPPGRPDVETEVTLKLAELAPDRCRVQVVHTGWEHAPELRPPHELGSHVSSRPSSSPSFRFSFPLGASRSPSKKFSAIPTTSSSTRTHDPHRGTISAGRREGVGRRAKAERPKGAVAAIRVRLTDWRTSLCSRRGHTCRRCDGVRSDVTAVPEPTPTAGEQDQSDESQRPLTDSPFAEPLMEKSEVGLRPRKRIRGEPRPERDPPRD